MTHVEEMIGKAIELMADGLDSAAKEEFEAAFSEIKKILRNHSGDTDVQHKYLLLWGQALEAMDEPEQAILKLERAIQMKPDSEEALWTLSSLLLYTLEKPAEAYSVLKERLVPLNSEDNRYQDALAIAERAKQFEAKEEFKIEGDAELLKKADELLQKMEAEKNESND